MGCCDSKDAKDAFPPLIATEPENLKTHFLENYDKAHLCIVCNKKASQECANCKLARYCNDTCQQKDYENHKSLCKHYAAGESKHHKGIKSVGLIEYLRTEAKSVVEHFKAMEAAFGQSVEDHMASLLRFDKEGKEFLREYFVERQKRKEEKKGGRNNMKPLPADEVPKDLAGIVTYKDYYFENWGHTIRRYPGWMFVPTTIEQVQRIVKWSAAEGLRVRCAGYTHSWTDIYTDDKQVLICMLPPHVIRVPAADPPSEGDLHEIKLLSRESKSGHKLVRVGGAVTNDQFRKFANQNDLCLPCNVVLVENTFAGSNASMSHGSGLTTHVLPDYVYEIEIVDATGTRRLYSYEKDSKEIMQAACASMGTFGVTVSLVFKVNPMTYARFNPVEEDMEKAIPPPSVTSGPDYEKFCNRVYKHYYNEFFWFPYNKRAYVNCWHNDGKKSDVKEFPNDVKLEQLENYASNLLMTSVFTVLPETWQAEIFSILTMEFIAKTPATTTLMDSIHFRRGIHNMTLLNYELEIPLVESKKFPGFPDLSSVQSLWWGTVKQIETWKKKEGKAPIRLAVEMRLYANSDCLLPPQAGNRWTLALEVASFGVAYDEYMKACQTLTDQWMAGAPPASTLPRPHWAKTFQGLNFHKKPVLDYFKTEAYVINGVNHIEQFKKIRNQINPDPRNMFSNKFLDQIFDLQFKHKEKEEKQGGER